MKTLLRPALICVVASALIAAHARAQDWTQTSAPSNGWDSVACSADGSKLIALAPKSAYGTGGVYVSANSGITWTLTSVTNYALQSCASSADGRKLVVLSQPGIYVSTNSRSDWLMATNPPVYWGQVACSTDGTKWIAVGGYSTGPRSSIYISTNSGATWASNDLVWSGGWSGAASSADGTRLAVAALRGPIYTCTDSGATWVSNAVPNDAWRTMASSADGRKLVAAAYPVPSVVATSDDYGAMWRTSSLSSLSLSVACSADGAKLITAGGPVFTSSDGGCTWSSNNMPFPNQGLSVAMSADGNKMIAAAYAGGIYTLQVPSPPTLNIALDAGNLRISWTVPSGTFVLQRNPNLSTINWETLTNIPVLNLTNLLDEVTLRPSDVAGFYRLASP